MKDQHTLIKGYRNLTQEEVDLMNKIKEQGEQLAELIEELRQKNVMDANSIDMRWVSIGATDLQTGIMALVRSVAQPNSF